MSHDNAVVVWDGIFIHNGIEFAFLHNLGLVENTVASPDDVPVPLDEWSEVHDSGSNTSVMATTNWNSISNASSGMFIGVMNGRAKR